MTEGAAPFVHRFVPGSRDPAAPVLLLLHGTGGDENDLLTLGSLLWPGAALLSPRGKTLENGMPRFFRRLAEGVFDVEDLSKRTQELADFVSAAREEYGLAGRPIVAVGFSNGANIAASMLLLRPETLSGAVLFRAMSVPFAPAAPGGLAGTPVFISAGRDDPIVSPDQPERLAALLRDAGAAVTLHWDQGGHGLSPDGVLMAKQWLAESGIGTRRTGP